MEEDDGVVVLQVVVSRKVGLGEGGRRGGSGGSRIGGGGGVSDTPEGEKDKDAENEGEESNGQ